MNRSMVAWKSEEKELSVILYKKLYGLTIIYPANKELLECLNDEMFLKANQQAFFLVMHYLFNLYDESEFRKRFYWPIINKKGESEFRSATVEFLKCINEQHNMNWTNINSYLVLVPGGMRIIIFMLEFASFIIQERIERLLKLLNTDDNVASDTLQLSDHCLRVMRLEYDIYTEETTKICSDINKMIQRLEHDNKEKMERMILFSQRTKVDLTKIMSEKFLKDFEESNVNLFRVKFSQPCENIRMLDKQLKNLNIAIEATETRQSQAKAEQIRLQEILRRLQKRIPLEPISEQAIDRKSILWKHVIRAFIQVYPHIIEQLNDADEIPVPDSSVLHLLTDLQREFKKLYDDLEKRKSHINEQSRAVSIRRKPIDPPSPCATETAIDSDESDISNNYSLEKFTTTPTIKLELEDETYNNVGNRLFLAATHEKDIFQQRYSKTGTPQRSLQKVLVRRAKNLNQSSNSKNTPRALLLPLEKQQDMTTIGRIPSSWKGHRSFILWKDMIAKSAALPSDECNGTTMPMNAVTNEGLPQIACDHVMYEDAHSELTEKHCTVKKLQDDSFVLFNTSTSPSGRLDSFVTNKGHSNNAHHSKSRGRVEERESNNDESNIGDLSIPCDDADSLFNTSDSVLKDILL